MFVEDIKDESCTKALKSMKDGDIAMLENIRFYKEEEENDKDFAKLLASFADIYVFDAFATAHRKHASTYGVAEI